MPRTTLGKSNRNGVRARHGATTKPKLALRGVRPREASPAHVDTVERLQEALNATFESYRDTHLAHFNVRGASFPQLHALFEAQYNETWLAVDVIAERIRSLGHLVTHGALALPESTVPQSVEGILDHLRGQHVDVVVRWQELFDVAEAAGDHATGDLCNERVRAHQKHAWMIEATIENA